MTIENDERPEIKKREEFKELTEPLIKWMINNYHPHATIIITCDSAELLEGAIAVAY